MGEGIVWVLYEENILWECAKELAQASVLKQLGLRIGTCPEMVYNIKLLVLSNKGWLLGMLESLVQEWLKRYSWECCGFINLFIAWVLGL